VDEAVVGDPGLLESLRRLELVLKDAELGLLLPRICPHLRWAEAHGNAVAD
jgi:hypothetical protein